MNRPLGETFWRFYFSVIVKGGNMGRGYFVLGVCSLVVVSIVTGGKGQDFNDADFIKNLVENSTAIAEDGISYQKNYCEDDELAEWKAPYNISRNFPYYLAGFDDENRPIWVIEFGRWDVRSAIEKGPAHLRALEKYARQTCYRAFQSIINSKTIDFPEGEGTIIVDADGLDINQLYSIPTIAFALKLAREYRFLLTKYVGSVVIINANHVLSIAIRIVRPVLGEIFDRVEVFGTNKSRWLPELLSRFPKDQLPEWYGGSKSFKPVAVYG